MGNWKRKFRRAASRGSVRNGRADGSSGGVDSDDVMHNVGVIGTCEQDNCAVCDPAKVDRRHIQDPTLDQFPTPWCGQNMRDMDTVIGGPMLHKPITCEACAQLVGLAERGGC